MSAFDISTFEKLRDEFNKVSKRILKEAISTNPVTLKAYETDIIKSFNDLREYANLYYKTVTSVTQGVLCAEITKARAKLENCLRKLNVGNTNVGTISEPVTESKNLQASTSKTVRETEDLRESTDETVEESEKLQGPSDTLKDSEYLQEGVNNNLAGIDSVVNAIQNSETVEMADGTKQEYLRLCAQTIQRNYGGDPLGVTAFINSVQLLKTMAGNTHQQLLLDFIQTRLEGKALECIPQKPESVDKIIEALKKKIRPDSSKVITGKMMALKSDRNNLQNFSKQAEELAEALKRSLIFEGISEDKSQEMVVEKMVEMCRQSARSDLVKSVLASTSFTDPKEVVSKFIVESSTDAGEKSVMSFNSQRGYRGRGGRVLQFNGRNRYQNHGNRNFRPNYNSNNRGNFHNNNNRGRFNNHRGHRGRNNYNVRYAGNEEVPTPERRGHPNQDQLENQNSENQIRVVYTN